MAAKLVKSRGPRVSSESVDSGVVISREGGMWSDTAAVSPVLIAKEMPSSSNGRLSRW